MKPLFLGGGGYVAAPVDDRHDRGGILEASRIPPIEFR